jgi:hypothetical protein
MVVLFDKVEMIGEDLFVVQITIGPAEPGRDYPSVRVRIPMRKDEIGALCLEDIRRCALEKVPDLLKTVSSAIDEGFQPAPLG